MKQPKEMHEQTSIEGTQEVLDGLMDELMAMEASSVRKFNLSVPATISNGLKCWKSFCEDRERFTEIFRSEAFNPEIYGDLEARLGTLWYTDALLQKTADPQGDVSLVMEEIVPLHAKFAKAAQYLWSDDAKVGSIVDELRSGYGYMDKADDLFRYVPLFQEHWDDVKDRCDIRKSDIEQARNLSSRYMNATVAVPDSEIDRLRDLRDRAAEYLRRGVDDIRDAAQYVFRKQLRAMDRYPSLYNIKPARKAKTPEPPVEQEAPLPKMPLNLPGPKLSI